MAAISKKMARALNQLNDTIEQWQHRINELIDGEDWEGMDWEDLPYVYTDDDERGVLTVCQWNGQAILKVGWQGSQQQQPLTEAAIGVRTNAAKYIPELVDEVEDYLHGDAKADEVIAVRKELQRQLHPPEKRAGNT